MIKAPPVTSKGFFNYFKNKLSPPTKGGTKDNKKMGGSLVDLLASREKRNTLQN